MKKPATETFTLLAERWTWITLGCVGYLIALYGIFVGLEFDLTMLTFPIVLLPLCFGGFALQERMKAVALCSAFIYLFLLVVLVHNTYFPSTVEMVLELFFVLLITIPAFLLRAPMYLLFGVGRTDAFLLLSGLLFLLLYVWAIVRVPRMKVGSLKLLLGVVVLSIFITSIECVSLGTGIRHVTDVSGLDRGLRNYYRVASENTVTPPVAPQRLR